MLVTMVGNSLRQRFFEQSSKAFPPGATAGTCYPEEQMSGLGI